MRGVLAFFLFQLNITSALCAPDTSNIFERYTVLPDFNEKNQTRAALPWYEISTETFYPSLDLDLKKLLSSCDFEKNVSEQIRFLKESQNYKFKLIMLDRFNTKPLDIYIEYKFNGTTIRQRFVRGDEYCRRLTSFIFQESRDIAKQLKDKEIDEQKRLLDKYK
jgi:hypothetical protein